MRCRKLANEDIAFAIIIIIVCAFICIVMAYPFYYLVIYSISDPAKIRPGFMLLPRGVNFAAYHDILVEAKVPNALLVSVIRSIVGPTFMLTVTSMASYAMSKRELIGHKFLSRYIVFTMYISAGLIPTYQMIYMLNLAHTFWVYVLPGIMDVFSFILIRTYIEGVPEALEESAMIDGSGYFNTFIKIIVPVSKPIIATVVLFSIVSHWNAYTDTMFYNGSDTNLHTISYVLMQYMKSNQVSLETAKRSAGIGVRPDLQMIKTAITTITILPIMCVYPILQKYFVQGIMIGAIKG